LTERKREASPDWRCTPQARVKPCPGVDSDPDKNEYQEHFLGVKAAGA